MCRHPTALSLKFPAYNETNVFNIDMALEWEEVTTSMIGTPCSAVYGVPTINIYLNSENELAASGTSIPFSVIMNTSAYTIQSSPIGALLFFFATETFRFVVKHYLFLENRPFQWKRMGFF